MTVRELLMSIIFKYKRFKSFIPSKNSAMKTMRLIYLISIILAFFSTLSSVTAQFVGYQNSKHSYSIAYPNTWELEERQGGSEVNFKASNNGKTEALVQALVFNIPEEEKGLSMEQLKKISLNSINQLAVPEIRYAEERGLSSYQGLYFDYTYSISRKDTEHWISWIIRKDDQYFIFRYKANKKYDDYYLDLVVGMFSSIGIEGPNRNNSVTSVKGTTEVKDSLVEIPDNGDQLGAGDVSPDAISLEVNRMSLFFGDVALIAKGNASQSQALIDDSGSMVQPFNKYQYSDHSFGTITIFPELEGQLSAFQFNSRPLKVILATHIATGNTHVLDSKGELITEFDKDLRIGNFDIEGYTISSLPGTKFQSTYPAYDFLFVKYDGGIIPATRSYQVRVGNSVSGRLKYPDYGIPWSGGMLPSNPMAGPPIPNLVDKNQLLYGFINREGNIVIEPAFNSVSEFSQNLSFVSQMNDFGEERWGAIDNNGKLTIPFQFRNRPGRFSNNRALITSFGTKFKEYAFIDKTGKIVIQLPKSENDTVMRWHYIDNVNPKEDDNVFKNGYCFVSLYSRKNPNNELKGIYLLDTAGVFFPIEAALQQKLTNMGFPLTNIEFKSIVKNDQFIFSLSHHPRRGTGIADVEGNIIIPPVFQSLYPFEEESNLQYAVYYPDTSNSQSIVGYIDRRGVFKIILSAQSGY